MQGFLLPLHASSDTVACTRIASQSYTVTWILSPCWPWHPGRKYVLARLQFSYGKPRRRWPGHVTHDGTCKDPTVHDAGKHRLAMQAVDQSEFCQRWAAAGECARNAEYMLQASLGFFLQDSCGWSRASLLAGVPCQLLVNIFNKSAPCQRLVRAGHVCESHNSACHVAMLFLAKPDQASM